MIRAVVVMLAVAMAGCVDTGPPSLDISASTTASGLQFTNRMSGPITECRVIARERGRTDEWTALVAKVDRMETATMPWAAFTSATGDRMPRTAAASIRTVSVLCVSPDGKSVDAGLMLK